MRPFSVPQKESRGNENEGVKLSIKTVPIMELPNEDSNEDVISSSDSERTKPLQQHDMF